MKPNEDNSNQRLDDDAFWLRASEPSLAVIWDNPEDDIYAELLECDDEGVLTELRANRESDREFTLNDLLAGVTKKNRHPEVDFGHPVGEEKL
jgi:hypothetical protein